MRERLSTAAAPLLAACAAFSFGYLTTGAIENDHFVMLARAFQVLYGDWPVRDFVDPGQPFAYLVSSAAAALFGQTLLVNVVLSLLFLAATVAFVYGLSRRATGSAIAAVAASFVTIVFYPRLYNTTKIVVPVVAIALGWQYGDRPGPRQIVVLAAWTAVAFLMRHDYAVYVVVANVALLGLTHAADRRTAVRRIVAYAGLSLLLVSPWLAYVQWQEGVGDYFASALRFSVAEQRRTAAGWPRDPAFYLCIAVPIAGLALSFRRGARLNRAQLASASLLVLLVDVAFLRDRLGVRIADVVAPMAVLASALAGHVWSSRAVGRAAVVALVVAVPAAAIPATARLRSAATPADAVRHVAEVTRRLDQAAPEIQPDPSLALLIAYLSRCTAPGDRVLVSGFGPEIPVLAHRPFASGLASWIPGYYEDPRDVARAIAQLDRERVSVAVMLDGSRVFFSSWPALGEWLMKHGMQEHPVEGVSTRIRIWLRAPASAASLDARTGLPCAVSAIP